MRLLKPKFWHKKNSLLSILMLPISYFIQFLAFIKNIFFVKNVFNIPIICVGNIYLGGTGKTPLCIEIFKILSKLKKYPAIIKKDYTDQKDEVNLLKRNKCEIFLNKKRKFAITNAINSGHKTLILDDGFQDFSIKKDLNILCFNSDQLDGNGYTIPSGPLREPLKSIKNCKILFINGKKNFDFENKVKKISPDIKIFYSKYIPTNLDNIRKKNLFAFAGIGNPENFLKTLNENNLKVFKKIYFPDHYNYKKIEIEKLIKISNDENLKIITTEKDYYRIEHMGFESIDYLKINLEIDNREKFIEEIIKLYD